MVPKYGAQCVLLDVRRRSASATAAAIVVTIVRYEITVAIVKDAGRKLASNYRCYLANERREMLQKRLRRKNKSGRSF